ncbi:PHD finger protein [Aspergillus chevalieri]|uniref:PHD-type domain-containing protein n=1 Tax=Aspergillus chevalieri TaxID=182096 RepID=A0A7R7VFA9_ASPCH|nr:uncharacterized protein ACHE_10091A [Aspergillus chevalieri]BCR82689.1 hypothetical protein ACHE_10091A [Aspergillus chevalieri]
MNMLRTPTDLNPNYNAPGHAGQGRLLNNPTAPATSRLTSADPVHGALTLSETDRSNIYYEWIRLGKPHNIVCSQCRRPDQLLLCETCCRSYHTGCIPSSEVTAFSGKFHCPSCRNKNWDRLPPQFSGRSSPNASRSTTPSGRDRSRRNSPSRLAKPSGHISPIASGTPLTGLPGSSGHTSPMEWQGVHGAGQQSDKLSQARSFLIENGAASQEHNPMILYQIAHMMEQLESQQRLLQETQELREENVRLHHINRELRAHAHSRSPHDSAVNSPIPNIPRPVADTSGKSWDRIVMDLL